MARFHFKISSLLFLYTIVNLNRRCLDPAHDLLREKNTAQLIGAISLSVQAAAFSRGILGTCESTVSSTADISLSLKTTAQKLAANFSLQHGSLAGKATLNKEEELLEQVTGQSGPFLPAFVKIKRE